MGGTLARAAWGGMLRAASEIHERGTFTAFTDLPDVDAGSLRLNGSRRRRR